MERLDLKKHLRDPKYYNRDRDMEVALAWNALKKTLLHADRVELFPYIKSIKLTEKSIIISTTKPIVNSELLPLREDLHRAIRASVGSIHPHPQSLKTLIFR